MSYLSHSIKYIEHEGICRSGLGFTIWYRCVRINNWTNRKNVQDKYASSLVLVSRREGSKGARLIRDPKRYADIKGGWTGSIQSCRVVLQFWEIIWTSLFKIFHFPPKTNCVITWKHVCTDFALKFLCITAICCPNAITAHPPHVTGMYPPPPLSTHTKNLYDRPQTEPHPPPEHVITPWDGCSENAWEGREEHSRGRLKERKGECRETLHSHFLSASSQTLLCCSPGHLSLDSDACVFLLSSDEFYEQLRGHQASTGSAEPGKHQLPVNEPRWHFKTHLLHLRGPLLR